MIVAVPVPEVAWTNATKICGVALEEDMLPHPTNTATPKHVEPRMNERMKRL
jgi:hypothetical protein